MWPFAYAEEEELPQDPIGVPVDEGQMLPEGDLPQTPAGEFLLPGDLVSAQPVADRWHPDTPEWFKYLPESSLDDYLNIWRERWNAGHPPLPDWVAHMLGHGRQPQPSSTPPTSKARVDWVNPAEKQRVASAWGNLRVNLPPEHAPDLVGAPDDAAVRVRAAVDGSIGMELTSPTVEAYRTMFRGKDGALVIENGGIEIDPAVRGLGLGLEIFVQQVVAARAAGVNRITCMAAGDGRGGYASPKLAVYNGYYTWPLFGYDAAIDSLQNPQKIVEIRRTFPHAKTILDIFLTPGGRQWWKDNGCKIPRAVFDLTPGSRSLTVLQAYAEEKLAQRSRTPTPNSSPPQTPPGTSSSPGSAPAQFSLLPTGYDRHSHRAPTGGVAWKNKLYPGGKFVPSAYVEAQTPAGEPLNYGPEDELAGFLAATEAEPFEGTHHEVMADYLQDMGDQDEADFRRSIGRWLRVTPPTFRKGHERPWFVPGRFDEAQWPQGVSGVTIRMEPGSPYGWELYTGRGVDMPPDDSGAAWEAFEEGHPMYGGHGTSWRSYQEMIQSLRESFQFWRRRNEQQAAQLPPQAPPGHYPEDFT